MRTELQAMDDGNEATTGQAREQSGPAPRQRLPDESAEAYAAFQCYLDLGDGRRLRAVAETRGCYLSLIKRWSSKHQWRRRAGAWEESQRRHVATEAKAQEAAYERRLRNSEQLEKFAMAGLRSLLVRDSETGELRFDQRLKPAEIASLIRAACQMMPTPPMAPEESEEDRELGGLSEGELHRLQSLLTKGENDDDASDGT